MQEELNRIRNKDYTHIDEKLYGNMGIGNELDTTLAQLAELQKYLKSQIDSIEDQKEKEAAMKASQVVMAINIQQSRIFEKCRCSHAFRTILGMVKKVSKSFKTVKQGIEREIKGCMFEITEMVNDTFGFMTTSTNRKNNESAKLKAQIFTFQEQIHELKRKNEELQEKLDVWERAQQRIRGKLLQDSKNHNYNDQFASNKEKQTVSLFEEGSIATDRESTQKSKNYTSVYKTEVEQALAQNDIPRLPMPLRRQSSINKYERTENSVDKFMSHQNIRKQLLDNSANANVRARTIKNSPSGKSQSQIPSPTKKLQEKENEIMKLKGTQMANNRKSTKKLKLFSLI